jgi:hypothetical protein
MGEVRNTERILVWDMKKESIWKIQGVDSKIILKLILIQKGVRE